MKWNRTLSVAAATLAFTGLAGLNAPRAAAQELATGQYVAVGDHPCGGEEIATGATAAHALRQKAYVYRHCGKGSVWVRVDVKAGSDGPCLEVPAGKARVLKVLWVFMGRDTFRFDYRC